MRRVIDQFPDSKLTHQMLSYLVVGQTVPDELSVLALERALLDVQCTTRGLDNTTHMIKPNLSTTCACM